MSRSEKIVFFVEPDLKRAIEAAADADERTVSDFVRLSLKRTVTRSNNVQASDYWSEKIRNETEKAIARNSSKRNRAFPAE
jgi:hypothetical protein